MAEPEATPSDEGGNSAGSDSEEEEGRGDEVPALGPAPGRPSFRPKVDGPLDKVLAAGLAGEATERASLLAAKRKGQKRLSLGTAGTIYVPQKAGLAERQVQDLRDMFGLFDPDGTGTVALADIRSAAADAQLEKNSPEVWRMLACLNEEEEADFEKFVSVVTEPLGDSQSRAGASRLLALVGPEAAENNAVRKSDLRKMIDDLGIDISEQELDDMFEQADAGEDGRIEPDQFYEIMRGCPDED